MTEMLATPANMRRLAEGPVRVKGATLMAYSPRTFEEYSATAGDYWHMPEDAAIVDSTGAPMVLAYRYETVAIVDDGPDSLPDAFDRAADVLRELSDRANGDQHVSADFQGELDSCLDIFDRLHQQVKERTDA